MRRAACAVVLSWIALVAPAQQRSPAKQIAKDEIHLRAKVKAVVPLQEISGKVLPVDIDPHFALTVSVVSVMPAVADLTPRAVVTFAIHSPAIFLPEMPLSVKPTTSPCAA